MGSRLEAGGEAEQRKNQERWLVKKKQASKQARKQALSDAVYWMEVGGVQQLAAETDAEDAAGRATKREAVGYSQLVTHPVTTPYSRQLQYEGGQQQQQQATANNKKTELRPPKLPASRLRPMEPEGLTCGDTCSARSGTSASAAAPAGGGVSLPARKSLAKLEAG